MHLISDKIMWYLTPFFLHTSSALVLKRAICMKALDAENVSCISATCEICFLNCKLKIHLSFPSHLHCLISFSTSNYCLSLCYLSEDSVFRYHLTATWNKIILYVLYCVQDVIRPNWTMNIRKFHWIVNHEGESNWVLFLPFLGGRIELQPKSVIFTTMRLSTTQFVDLSRPWTSVLLECR